MHIFYSTWSGWSELAVPRLTGPESAALLMLAAGLLLFRTFRERYLLVWIAGWLCYFISLWAGATSHPGSPLYLDAVSHAGFVLAVCLFAGGVFVYTQTRKLLIPLAVVAVLLTSYAAVRVLFWPDSLPLRVGLEISYRIVACVAAAELIRFHWARTTVGVWLFCLTLPYFHLSWAPLNVYYPPATDAIGTLLLGLSLLMIVFDQSRVRMRRLAVINALNSSIMQAQQHGPMMLTALEEFKRLMGARAAWFRLLEDGNLVIIQQIGLSPEFLRDAHSVPMSRTLAQVLGEGKPAVIRTNTSDDEIRAQFKAEKFHHVVLVPVVGKKSAIGTLSLGSRRRINYAQEDLEFLKNAADQLGLAAENLRLVEQVLRSHRQWSNTFDSIHDCVLVHDAEYHVMKANRALLQRLVQAPADVMGRSCEEVLPHMSPWKNCPYCIAEIEEGFHEGADGCLGGYSIVSTSSYTEQGSKQKGTIHVIRDVTDRQVAEEKYRLLFEQMQEGVFVAASGGKVLDCNDAFVRMLGYANREELMAMNIESEIYASSDQSDALHRAMEAHNYVRNFEVNLRRKDGSLLTTMESSFATRNSDGQIERYQGFLLDITEKKNAEDEIRRRNRELNALNAMAVIATQSFDLDEILNLTLRQVITLLGGESGSIYLTDAEGTTFRRRAAWGLRSSDRARFAEVKFTDGFGDLVTRSRTEVITAEYLPHLPAAFADFVKADGFSWIWVLLWSKDGPIGIMGISSREQRDYTNNEENLLVAIGRQLSTTIEKVRLYEETCRAYDDLRLTQEQLLQSEKMSAVGQLIAGVAHELNNPLTAILGYAQLLESEGLSEKAADFVNKLFKQAQRTHRVVQNLLSFARQRKPHKEEVDICKVLDETLVLRDYDLKVNDVQLIRETESSIPSVTADPHQLEQVFLNIINNAVDAMLEAGKGGTLTIRVFSRDGDVHIDFEDTGPGIKEPNRIFDPFYTTKNVGKGTGLGLSICYGIVKEHGGDISAANREGGGAVVEIILPAGQSTTVSSDSSQSTPRELAIQGRILLVEDEAAVLEFERDVLAGAGAQVITLTTAEEMKSRILNDSFDALIIDGMATGFTARDVYVWLGEHRPAMQRHVLFTFSSLAEEELREFLNREGIAYLVKPFEVADLIAQARRLLYKSQAATVGA